MEPEPQRSRAAGQQLLDRGTQLGAAWQLVSLVTCQLGAHSLGAGHCRPEPPTAVLKKGCNGDQELTGPGVRHFNYF